MKNVKPDRKPDPLGSGKMVEDFWGPSLKILGDFKFLDSLRDYDKDSIPPAIIKRIREKWVLVADMLHTHTHTHTHTHLHTHTHILYVFIHLHILHTCTSTFTTALLSNLHLHTFFTSLTPPPPPPPPEDTAPILTLTLR